MQSSGTWHLGRSVTHARVTFFELLLTAAAMNSLGAGGEEKPYLVNAANALTFTLMVVSCSFSSVIVRYIGIKWALIFGTLGYAPFAAGLYTNNRYGNQWLVLLGAALCGISAGVFWMAEAAIAISYPEPYNQGRFLGLWLSFRVGGQVLGGVRIFKPPAFQSVILTSCLSHRRSTWVSTQTTTKLDKFHIMSMKPS